MGGKRGVGAYLSTSAHSSAAASTLQVLIATGWASPGGWCLDRPIPAPLLTHSHVLARQVANPSLQPPSYYKQPFHAYRDGNLCWEAAVEMTAAARSVHSVVYDPEGKRLDPE